MVKRQTVWLSTMMVLSLMLIGYYTVGSNTPGKTSLTNTGVTTSGANDKPSVQTDSSAPDPSKLSGSDYFSQLRMDAADREAKEEDRLMALSVDTHASADQVAQAKKQLDDLQALQAKIETLQDSIKALGYKDVVISHDNGKIQVVVEADQLSNDQVVKILNTVHTQLNVSSADVTVSWHK